MEIADYIPDYPELKATFNNNIFRKREFYNLKTGIEPQKITAGKLWNHQKLVARFLAPSTPYDGQLFFHKPGTGKTCAAASVAEINKNVNGYKSALIVVPNKNLANQWRKQIATVCTGGQYIPEDFEELKPSLRDKRRDNLVAEAYDIVTLEKFRRIIDEIKSDKELQRRFSNRVIIIDEAHNLRIQTDNEEETKGRYQAFHRLLHVVTNTKKILLTGTPIYDTISEFATIMNLILPMDKQLPTERKFIEEYIDDGFKNVDKLLNWIAGYVSYIREGGNFPIRKDLGKPEWTKFIKTVNLEMPDIQLKGYQQAYEQDTTSGERGLWKNTRQAAVFVYERNGELMWGSRVTKDLTTTARPRKISIDGKEITHVPMMLNPRIKDLSKNLRENLELYSPKFHAIIEFLKEHPNEPIFIFTPLVSGGGGAIFFTLILELFGYSQALGTDREMKTPSKRYAIITGDTKSDIQRKKLIEYYNSPENRNGEIIQVMIATKTISEGTSFTNVLHEIVISPYWNNSATEQAIGRGLRADSLTYKPLKQRIVTVQQLAITNEELDEEKNIDARLYKLSESKDYQIKSGERILKQAAWDCPLNYERNIRETDSDYSRNCDYQKCNYACYQIVPDKTQKIWEYTTKELENSNYLVLYAGEELAEIVESIKQIFSKNSLVNISGLQNQLQTEDLKMIVLAIEYMIENNIKVRNKWGISCFLRKAGNTLFLTDSIISDDIILAWYSRFPFIVSYTPLGDLVDAELMVEDAKIIDRIDLADDKSIVEQFNNLSLEGKIYMLEYLLKLQGSVTENKNYKILLDLFNKHYSISENTGHDLEKLKVKHDYYDFTKGEGGILRCLNGLDWGVCDKKAAEDLKQKLSAKISLNEDITTNKWGYYAIASDKGIKIVDTTKAIKAGDKRAKPRGQECMAGWDKWELIKILVYLKIKIDEPLVEGNFKEIIERNGMAEAISPENNEEELRLIATLSDKNFTKSIICGYLQTWFTQNNLVVYS